MDQIPVPFEFISDNEGNHTKEPNPKFLHWVQQDQNVLCWINATLSESILAHVVGLSSAQDVWVALERRFASFSRSYIIRLKTQLQTIKKGSLSMTEYIQKIKHLSDSLASVSCPIDNEGLIIYVLNELPVEYGPFKTSIRTRSDPILVEDLHVQLLCEELNLEGDQHKNLAPDFSATALTASESLHSNNNNSKPMHYNHSNRGRGYNGCGRIRFNGRGRGSHYQICQQCQSSRPCCQICNRTGNTALDCYHRMDYSYQGRNSPSQLTAMTATYNSAPEQTWFVHSGATNHITNDI